MCYAVVGISSLISCDKIINNYYSPQNVPPVIVSYGPQLPADSTEAYGFRLFVFVSDTNGVDDISTVLLKIDSVAIYRIIARPDISGDSSWVCTHAPSFTDTVDISSLVPGVVQGGTAPFDLVSAGYYTSINFGVPLVNLDAASDYIRAAFVCARGDVGYFQVYFVTPPAVPTTVRIFTTYLDIKYFGISATVYDQAGLSDTVNFGDFRFIYTTVEEKSYPP